MNQKMYIKDGAKQQKPGTPNMLKSFSPNAVLYLVFFKVYVTKSNCFNLFYILNYFN